MSWLRYEMSGIKTFQILYQNKLKGKVVLEYHGNKTLKRFHKRTH